MQKSASYALPNKMSFESFNMLYCRVSKFQESVTSISFVFGFILYLKHQGNTNKLTLLKAKYKLSYNTVVDNTIFIA